MDPNQPLLLQLAIAQQQIMQHNLLVQNNLRQKMNMPHLAGIEIGQHKPFPNGPPIMQLNGVNIDPTRQINLATPIPQQLLNPLQQPNAVNLKRSILMSPDEAVSLIEPKRSVHSVASTIVLPNDSRMSSDNPVNLQLAQSFTTLPTSLFPSPPSSGFGSLSLSPTSVQSLDPDSQTSTQFSILNDAPPKLYPIVDDSTMEINSRTLDTMAELITSAVIPDNQALSSSQNKTESPKIDLLVETGLAETKIKRKEVTAYRSGKTLRDFSRVHDDVKKADGGVLTTPAAFEMFLRLNPIIDDLVEEIKMSRREKHSRLFIQLTEARKQLSEKVEELTLKDIEIETKARQLEKMQEELNENCRENALLRGDITQLKSMLAVAQQQNNPQSNTPGLRNSTGQVISLGRS